MISIKFSSNFIYFKISNTKQIPLHDFQFSVSYAAAYVSYIR